MAKHADDKQMAKHTESLIKNQVIKKLRYSRTEKFLLILVLIETTKLGIHFKEELWLLLQKVSALLK